MQHEVLAVLALERIDDLLVLPGAERGDAQRLRLAAREQRGAVRARQNANLGDDRPHCPGVAAVDAHAGVEDAVADDVRLQVMEDRPGLLDVDAPLRSAPLSPLLRTASTLSWRAPLSGSR